MSNRLDAALEYAHRNFNTNLAQLQEFLRIPSISTDEEHKADMLSAAEWLQRRLSEIGASRVDIMPTGGHPVVYGELIEAGLEAPTVLVYGHYDVQPAEPLELWHSKPFEPEVRGEDLYARGATDMKGQIIGSLAAVEALAKTGALPVNLKFLIEGEEEIGSSNLKNFIAANRELLQADIALNPDTGMMQIGLPTITYALRGLVYFELWLYGPKGDLHSGLYGGTVHNPAQAMCELVAGMHNEYGRITLPGFYDNVRELDPEERAELARLPIDDQTFLDQTGVPALWGESEYTPVERVGARPTLEINGLYSGFIGEGQKTVLPSKAMAKISCRLVPDQTPDIVQEQLESYLQANVPETLRYTIKRLSEGDTAITDRHTPAIAAMVSAMEKVWQKRPVFKREGGSVPVVAHLQTYLGIESLNVGVALPDDNMHAPNEKVHLPNLVKEIDMIIHFLSEFGAAGIERD